MNKKVSLIVVLFLILSLLTSCGKTEPSSVPDTGTEGSGQSTADPGQAQPQDDDGGDDEDSRAGDTLSFVFDPNAYEHTNDDDFMYALVYATNRSEKAVRATLRYRIFDKEGNQISVYDRFKGRNSDQFTADLAVPCGAEDLPICFLLPDGIKYDYSTGEEMPEVDHVEFELVDTLEYDYEDLSEHFAPGEPEFKNDHLYLYVDYDQYISDNFGNLHFNYTLLGYSGGAVTCVCGGSNNYSVEYGNENYDGSVLVYHRLPKEPVDEWKLFLGEVSGE